MKEASQSFQRYNQAPIVQTALGFCHCSHNQNSWHIRSHDMLCPRKTFPIQWRWLTGCVPDTVHAPQVMKLCFWIAGGLIHLFCILSSSEKKSLSLFFCFFSDWVWNWRNSVYLHFLWYKFSLFKNRHLILEFWIKELELVSCFFSLLL